MNQVLLPFDVQLQGLTVSLAVSEIERRLADSFVVKHHSYVNSAKTVGRVLKYLIYWDGVMIGTFWLGSGFKPTPKAILNYFKMTQKEFDSIFNQVADNKRFCIISPKPNTGSQILKAIRLRARADWKNRYGDDLNAIVTTIGDGKKGSVYLADNWQAIGETSGLPSARQSVSMKWDDKESINRKFVKPTGENRKKILITTRLF
jgi:hypothetical protein